MSSNEPPSMLGKRGREENESNIKHSNFSKTKRTKYSNSVFKRVSFTNNNNNNNNNNELPLTFSSLRSNSNIPRENGRITRRPNPAAALRRQIAIIPGKVLPSSLGFNTNADPATTEEPPARPTKPLRITLNNYVPNPASALHRQIAITRTKPLPSPTGFGNISAATVVPPNPPRKKGVLNTSNYDPFSNNNQRARTTIIQLNNNNNNTTTTNPLPLQLQPISTFRKSLTKKMKNNGKTNDEIRKAFRNFVIKRTLKRGKIGTKAAQTRANIHENQFRSGLRRNNNMGHISAQLMSATRHINTINDAMFRNALRTSPFNTLDHVFQQIRAHYGPEERTSMINDMEIVFEILGPKLTEKQRNSVRRYIDVQKAQLASRSTQGGKRRKTQRRNKTKRKSTRKN